MHVKSIMKSDVSADGWLLFQLEQKLHRSKFKKVLPPIQNVAAARETMTLIEQFEREIVETNHRPDTA